MAELKNLNVDAAVEHARETLFEEGAMEPIFYAFTEDGSLVLPFRFKDDKEKKAMLDVARLLFAGFGVREYITINEGWAVKFDKRKPDEVAESGEILNGKLRCQDSSRRVEVLIVCAIERDARVIVVKEMKRDARGKFLGLIDYSDTRLPEAGDKSGEAKGEFTELLPSEEIYKEPELQKALLDALYKAGMRPETYEDGKRSVRWRKKCRNQYRGN